MIYRIFNLGAGEKLKESAPYEIFPSGKIDSVNYNVEVASTAMKPLVDGPYSQGKIIKLNLKWQSTQGEDLLSYNELETEVQIRFPSNLIYIRTDDDYEKEYYAKLFLEDRLRQVNTYLTPLIVPYEKVSEFILKTNNIVEMVLSTDRGIIYFEDLEDEEKKEELSKIREKKSTVLTFSFMLKCENEFFIRFLGNGIQLPDRLSGKQIEFAIQFLENNLLTV